MSSENTWLLCSRSLSQPRLKVSVNVNLDDILCIAEPFVTKPSMVIHHYKPECHVQKMGCYLQGQGHGNRICVHTMKSWPFLLYVLNCWFLATNLVWQCMIISWKASCEKVAFLYSRSRSQWRFWTSVNVCLETISDRSNLVWWCIIISQSIIQKYHFAMFKVKATIVSTKCLEILKLLQSKLVWWFITTRQGKTLWKKRSCFYIGHETENMAWVTVD